MLGRLGLCPHSCRHGPGRPSVSCRLPTAPSLAGAGPATRGPGGGCPGSQPVAHHCHPAHPLPAEPLLQCSTDCDQHPGTAWQQRRPPVLSRSRPGRRRPRTKSGGLMGAGTLSPHQHLPVPPLGGLAPSQTPRTQAGLGSDCDCPLVGSGHQLPPGAITQDSIPSPESQATARDRVLPGPAHLGEPQALTLLVFAERSLEGPPVNPAVCQSPTHLGSCPPTPTHDLLVCVCVQ